MSDLNRPKLQVEQLEDRNLLISLIFDYTFAPRILGTPLQDIFETAALDMADNLTPIFPYEEIPYSFTADTQWGHRDVGPLPADTMLVFVGPSNFTVLGSALPVPWHTDDNQPYIRNPGMMIGISPNGNWMEAHPDPDKPAYSLRTVVQHEVLHGVDIIPHSLDPNALSYAYLPTDTVKDANLSDVALAAEAYWHLELTSLDNPPRDPSVRIHNPWGFEGYLIVSVEVARTWRDNGNLHAWNFVPAVN